MTVSANASFDLSRDAIIRSAYQLCGVVPAGQQPDGNQIAMASDFLNMGLKALQSDGIILRTIERTTTTLTAGTAQYTCASDTLDVDDRTVYVTSGTGTATTDLRLEPISRGMYMELSLKAVQGQPTQIYVEKGAAVSFFLYPTPDANWASVTYPRVRLLRDMDTGTVTPDLPSKYLKYVTYMLATDLALHHGLLPRHGVLAEQAAMEKERAVQDDTERGPVRFIATGGRRFRGRF